MGCDRCRANATTLAILNPARGNELDQGAYATLILPDCVLVAILKDRGAAGGNEPDAVAGAAPPVATGTRRQTAANAAGTERTQMAKACDCCGLEPVSRSPRWGRNPALRYRRLRAGCDGRIGWSAGGAGGQIWSRRRDAPSLRFLVVLVDCNYRRRVMASADLAGIDLNLPVLFEALLIERSASRAARRLGLAQPSASNALNRLRVLFGGDLFMRTPQEMRPAPRALGSIISALQHVRAALKPPTAFDPAVA